MQHRSGNPIRNSLGLYEVTKNHFKKMEVIHLSSEEIEKIYEENNIQDRFDGSSTISGTRSFHHFECDGSLSHLFARQYSISDRIKKVKISNF